MSGRKTARERVLRDLERAIKEAGLNPGNIRLYAVPSDCQGSECDIRCYDDSPVEGSNLLQDDLGEPDIPDGWESSPVCCKGDNDREH